MPPKAKFTKEQITKAALGVVSEKGAQALTAKELGAALGTSTTPIFTVFNSGQLQPETSKYLFGFIIYLPFQVLALSTHSLFLPSPKPTTCRRF